MKRLPVIVSLLALLIVAVIVGGRWAPVCNVLFGLHERDTATCNKDVLNAFLILAQEYYPDIDPPHVNAEIDKIVDEIRMQIDETKEPHQIVQIINKHFFEKSHIESTGLISESSLLPNRVLQEKKGHCLGLSLIYLTLARRLGFDVYAKIVPNHIFLSYNDGTHAFNIETTSAGATLPDENYSSYLPYPQERPASAYLRKLSDSELLGVLLTNLGTFLKPKDEALDAQKKALKLFPELPSAHANIGLLYLGLGDNANAKKHLRRAMRLDATRWQIHKHFGYLYFSTADYEKAADSYLKAIGLLQRSFTIRAGVQGLPRNRDPLDLAKECLENEDTPFEQLFGIGVVAFQRGEYGLAVKLFQRALKLRPKDPNINSCQAILSFRMGDYESALKYSKIANEGLGYAPTLGITSLTKTLTDCYDQLGKSYGMMKK